MIKFISRNRWRTVNFAIENDITDYKEQIKTKRSLKHILQNITNQLFKSVFYLKISKPTQQNARTYGYAYI